MLVAMRSIRFRASSDAIILARAVDDPELSEEILREVRAVLD
jgi:hypothetical protein